MGSLGGATKTQAQYNWVGKPNCTEDLHRPFRGNYWYFLLFVSDSHCFKPWNSCNLCYSSLSLDFNGGFDWCMSLCMFGVIVFGFLGV